MAWLFQDKREVEKLGAKAAPWYVGWRQGGKPLVKKVGPKMKALDVKKTIEGRQVAAEFDMPIKKPWAEFRQEYEATILPGMRSERSREESRRILESFEKLMSPGTVRSIDRRMLDGYAAKRRDIRGKKRKSKMSAQTINKEIRTIRAALSQAHEWGYLPLIPSTPKLDGFEYLKRFVTWEDFVRIWQACDHATLPDDVADAGQWWRALLKVFWVSGVRVGSILTATWEDTSLDRGIIILRAKHTKQKKDHIIHVAKAVPELEAIRQLKDPRVFPWSHNRKTLDEEFDYIQKAAGIDLTCPHASEHDCTDSCHLYGFHDLRRSHATFNAGRVDDRDLQRQMGHATFETTKKYIKLAEEIRTTGYDAYMPEIGACAREALGKTETA